MDTVIELELLIKSRYPIICFETSEEERAESIIRSVINNMGVHFFVWTATRGLMRHGYDKPIYDTYIPLKALNHIGVSDLKSVYLLKDFHRYFNDTVIIRKIKDIAQFFKKVRSTIIITAPKFDIPAELKEMVSDLVLELPKEDELQIMVNRTLDHFSHNFGLKIKIELDRCGIDALVRNLKGLTLLEAERVMSKILLDDYKLSHDDLSKVLASKKELVERDGLLEYYCPDENIAKIGGFANLKGWLAKRKNALSREARSFGLEPPKGILIIGVQGCGKSLCAKTVATEWNIPLIKFDPANLYGKYVGESEANLRNALNMIESIAPVIVWIDEIEKAFSYSVSSESDAGLSKRIFGSFLSLLQDRQGAIFVIATSNDISQLPPELLRKGRFDEIFFVDLPDEKSREEIFRIHLMKRKFDPSSFNIKAIVNASAGFNGAEIEQSIISALYDAFTVRGELTTELVLAEIKRTIPLSETMSERIKSLREWARGRTVMA